MAGTCPRWTNAAGAPRLGATSDRGTGRTSGTASRCWDTHAVSDWDAWHDPYDDPNSALSQRLQEVRRQIELALIGRPLARCGSSACAPAGAWMSCPSSRRTGEAATLPDGSSSSTPATPPTREHAPDGIDVVQEDAGTTDACVGAVPADLLLFCGIFGNVADDDVRRAAAAVPGLCAYGATVVWTRSTHAPDLTPSIRRWLKDAGVTETSFVAEQPEGWSVGAGVFTGEPRPLPEGVRLFAFTTRPPVR